MDELFLVWMIVVLFIALGVLVITRRSREHSSICSDNMFHHSNGTTDDPLTLRNDLLARMMARKQNLCMPGWERE